MDKELKDLGYANGWGPVKPDEFKTCCEKKHFNKWETLKLARSIEKLCCPECKITWTVDSSD